MKKKILVEGPILTQSGYGEHARFVMRSLKSQEDVFDIYAIPLKWGQTSWLFENNEERRWIDSIINKTVQYVHQQGQFDIYIHVGIPNELKRKAPVTIEVTAGIESNKVAPEWIDILNRECDKVITVSEHSKEGLVNTVWKAQDQFGRQFDLKLTVPVEVVGYPVKEFNKHTEEYAKEKFPLDYDFNFLCVAQWGPRKNLPNTIQWFLEEFKNDNVGLICKVNHSNNSLLDRTACEAFLEGLLKNFPDRKCKVYLLHGDLSEEEVHNLYVHPQIKAIINFGHGEGFGLPLFEAAYCGLPVIAPDYSGHKDFLYTEVDGKKKSMFAKAPHELKKIQQEAVWNGVLHPESEWAFVKPFSAKLVMRECFKDYGRFKGQAKKLKEYLLNNQKDVFHEMAQTIYGEKIIKINSKELPKISIISSVYDADNFIESFLQDITRQTIFKDKCELILINANSPGNEEPIIKKYMEQYPNIIYNKLDKDPGIYAVWNMAIKMASGEYITNANMDDRKAPYSLEKHAKNLFVKENCDLVYADSFIVHEPNKTWEEISTVGCTRYNFEQFSPKAMLRGNLPHNNPMWRKTLHNKFGYFNENYRSSSDWEFWLTCVAGGAKFAKINEVLGIYYFNPKGISTNFENFSWKQKEEDEIYNKFLEIIKD